MSTHAVDGKPHAFVVDLYDRYAREFDVDRGRKFHERAWVERFLAHVPAGGTVLDVGCGTGEPIARYVIDKGYKVEGIDAAPAMVALCRERFPDARWHQADMRQLPAVVDGRLFDGVIAWDSFFHLPPDDQRALIPAFAQCLKSGAPLMFSSGWEYGESMGEWHGHPLYHASLGPDEYGHLLLINGFAVHAFVVEDPGAGDRTVWLATLQE